MGKHEKKEYTSSQITSVAIDPEQAVLEVCQTGGVFMNIGPLACIGTAGTTVPTMCRTFVRGSGGASTTAMNFSLEGAPS